jgi:hypothetical protein
MFVLDNSFNEPSFLRGSSARVALAWVLEMKVCTCPFFASTLYALSALNSSDRELATLFEETNIWFEKACKAEPLFWTVIPMIFTPGLYQLIFK